MADAGERRVQSMPHQRLDRDPSRLTTFPVPGFLASTFQEPDGVAGASEASKPVASPVKVRPPPMSAGNQYWMPDHLCKVCYDCSAAFSLFRRRHHCRLCGQIFCYECSNQFVDGTPHGFPGVIRVCKFCFQFADAAGKKVKENDLGRQSIGSLDGNEAARDSFSSRFDRTSRRGSGELGTMKPSPLVFGPPVDPNEEPSLLLSPVDSNSSDPAGLEQPADTNSFAADPVDFFDESDSVDVQRRFRPRGRTRRRHSSAELLGAIESGGLLEAEALALNNNGRMKASPKKDFSIPEETVPWGIGPHNSNNLHTQREMALDKYMQNAHEQIRGGIKLSVSALSNILPEYQSAQLDHLTETLEDMAFVVTGHLLFSMNFRSPSGFNYSNLVKVKSIAMSENVHKNKKESSYKFKWLAGTVCHKHLIHKQMARQVVNPRILLFGCGISYDRSNGTGRMSSLDTLLEQEKSYMAILVDKISALEPDVIFVEKTVSRHAQELLRERRISIVLNVKSEVLNRIARHTGAEVLTSVDHVDKANPAKVIGTCRSFTVKSIPVIPDEGLSPAKKSLQALTGVFMKAPAVPSRLRTDTYLYLDGCDPLNGCTVLVTGPSKGTLRVLKKLTRTVLSMAYQMLLEAHVLSDLSLSKSMLMSKESAETMEEQHTTWCTTSTLRVRDPGSPNPRYHQCVEAKHLQITACSDDDVSFGNFLNQELAALTLKCQNAKCNRLMADHVHSFSCRTGTITISFEELPDKSKQPLSMSMSQRSDTGATDKSFGSFSELSFTMGSERDINLLAMMTPNSFSQPSGSEDDPAVAAENGYPTVIFWRWCCECNGVVTPFIPLEKYIYKYSFARFLEVLFSEAEESVLPKSPTATCTHTSMESHVLFFNIGNSVARFDFSRKVSLHLCRADLKRGKDMKEPWEAIERAVVEKEVTSRLERLKELLQSLISSFTEKMQDINQAVEAFERTESGQHHARIILEVMCISKMVRSGDAMFSHKLVRLGEKPADSLGSCDAIQRALYLMACKWITCMLRLRKLIKNHLSTESAPPAPNSGSFTLGGITFHPTAVLSPIASPRVVEESTMTPSAIVKEPDWGEGAETLVRRRSSGALNSVTESEATMEKAVSSSSTIESIESSKRPVMSFPAAASSNGDGKEGTKAGWKEALWDIYRVLGRSEPGSDFTIDLPDELTAGHPSLPNRSKSRVVLVNEAKPITYVAYALSTDSYEEELDSWKVRVHSEAAESVAVQKENLDGASVVSTNWSRAALETSLNVPFKFTAVEIPLHLSLLSGKTSSTLGSTCWELSTIAYYPLQFEVLRDLFYGRLQSFEFSISHVANWDANGGKSGASFYRTLDDRFVIKHISSTEMQSFLGCLPGYFKYMASIYFDGRASLLSKTAGLYQTTITRKDSGQKTVQYICVMENAFYQKQLTRTYDLKGSSRNRFAKPRSTSEAAQNGNRVLLDGNFLEFTKGHPMGVLAEDHQFILKAVENDTAFLYSINIVDYSMVVGLSYRDDDVEERDTPSEMTVGIIDYLRQFDLIKRVESVGKSVGMIAGQSSPTIIEPGLYGKRFRDAIHRYFMPVSPISSGTNAEK